MISWFELWVLAPQDDTDAEVVNAVYTHYKRDKRYGR